MVEMCQFLHNSQTFLGVLLTLNVLCIFAFKNDSEGEGEKGGEINENNFILRFLHYYKEKLHAELRNLEGRVKEEVNSLNQSDDYRKLQAIIQNKDRYELSIRNEAMLLDVKYSLNWTNSNTTVTYGYLELNKIEASNEQQRAPLFTLAFGLVFFFVDELVNLYQINIYPNAIIFGWWFLLLSSVYWFVIWIFFLCGKGGVDRERKKNSFWQFIDHHLTPALGALVKIIICAGIFWFAIRFAPHLDQESCFISYGLALGILPISFIGLYREWCCGVKGRYSLTHIIGHLLSFVVYAMVLTWIVEFFSTVDANLIVIAKPEGDICLNILASIPKLRFGIILFSLLNGLILPFIIPYVKLKKIFFLESKKIKKGLVDLKVNQQALSRELGNLCKKLVV